MKARAVRVSADQPAESRVPDGVVADREESGKGETTSFKPQLYIYTFLDRNQPRVSLGDFGGNDMSRQG